MSTMLDSTEMDKLSYEIFSILENKFLFGGYDSSSPQTPIKAAPKSKTNIEKIRILSIDADADLLAAVSLFRLESSLRSRDPNARIADFFNIIAGSGAGGVLAAMLFCRGPDGRPLYSVGEARRFLVKNQGGIVRRSRGLKGIFQKSNRIFRLIFGESTLRDTLKPVLIPCYHLSTGAPFLFSRVDAIETDGYDFSMSDVCAATCACHRTVEMRSIDGKTKITAISGGAAMKNPTAAAITHVLNNKSEFPSAYGMEDLLVISLGDGGVNSVRFNGTPSRHEMLRIVGNGAADTVDEAVAMAFGHSMASNYVRVQASGFFTKKNKVRNSSDLIASKAEEMLSNRNVESVLFQGKKISEHSNAQKLDKFCLIKEQERRKSSLIPIVLMKQAMNPRSSSATISTTFTVSTATTWP